MKFIFLSLFFVFISQAYAKWTTEKPEFATVWSFDQNCVDLKLKDGKILRVQKKILGDRKVEARKTVIEFHRGALDQDLCK